jgi:hypothetical protein
MGEFTIRDAHPSQGAPFEAGCAPGAGGASRSAGAAQVAKPHPPVMVKAETPLRHSSVSG